MELQIQNLVSSIRKEGIEAANKEAESIIRCKDGGAAVQRRRGEGYRDSP